MAPGRNGGATLPNLTIVTGIFSVFQVAERKILNPVPNSTGFGCIYPVILNRCILGILSIDSQCVSTLITRIPSPLRRREESLSF